jgi:hypothetical protein
MTLTLNNNTPYLHLVSDFTSIPDSLLLFLTKLNEIRIKIDFPDQGSTTFSTFRRSIEADGTTRISKLNQGFDNSDEWRYHVFKSDVRGLPVDPARPNINECEAVLAFPIDQRGAPSPRTQQDIYAFLPVCTVGFNVSESKRF